MATVIVTCGKICSGKSCYSAKLKDSLNAVVLSTDEATYDLINNEQGEFYNVFVDRVNKYLTKKAAQIAKAGANVIFDRGLWTKMERREMREYFASEGVACEIHYVCVDDETWRKNISERNQRVLSGNGGSDFYLDDGLMNKLKALWEEPEPGETDFVYRVNRA